MTRRASGSKHSANFVLIGFIIILLAVLLVYGGGKLFSIAGTSGNQCSSTSLTINCGNQVNGTITSISQVQTYSNYGPLNNMAVYIIDFELNGNGQSVFSSSPSTLLKAINSTAKTNQTGIVSIGARLQSQQLSFEYNFQGQYLKLIKLEPVDIQYTYQNTAPLTSCTQANSTNQYGITCSGIDALSDEQQALNGYNNVCKSVSMTNGTESGGSVFAVNQYTGVFAGVQFQSAYVVACYLPVATSLGAIYQGGSPAIVENISVTYNNQTSSNVFYLSTVNPESYVKNGLFAQIYSYSIGSLNTYVGTSSPTLFYSSPSDYEFLPQATTTDINVLDELPSTAYQSGQVTIGSTPVSYIYSLSAMQQAIGQQNNGTNAYLQSHLQSTSPFAGMQLGGSPFYGLPKTGTLNVTKNPVYFPNIQFIATEASLGPYAPGVFVAVSKPKILSVSPNPVVIQSGAQATATFTVISQNATGSAYIVVRSLNQTEIAQSPSFPIGTTTSTVALSIGGSNSNLANINTQDIAQICSTNVAQCSNFTFDVVIKPDCNAYGDVYVNNTTCKSETTTCSTGYAWNGTQCKLICTPPSTFNATSQSCVEPPPVPPTLSIWDIIGIIAAVIVAIVVIAGASRRKRGARKSRS